MAKLYFYYSAMNAGKSTILLQSSYNYREKGMETLLCTPALDTRLEQGVIHSRIGLSQSATIFSTSDDLYQLVNDQTTKYSCILIDEAQFLTRDQVFQLTEITDQRNIPVLAYGLRTDFRGELFPGSQYLLAWADELVEIKTICHCGRKATMILRMNEGGEVVSDGAQVLIGGNDLYASTCRKHFKTKEPHATSVR
ncbi:MAG: thymidine kinase [Tatlockia sp.]|nr:thymidine kinase [Tatlockia sp.]